jgi:hypothetical protein
VVEDTVVDSVVDGVVDGVVDCVVDDVVDGVVDGMVDGVVLGVVYALVIVEEDCICTLAQAVSPEHQTNRCSRSRRTTDDTIDIPICHLAVDGLFQVAERVVPKLKM